MGLQRVGHDLVTEQQQMALRNARSEHLILADLKHSGFDVVFFYSTHIASNMNPCKEAARYKAACL